MINVFKNLFKLDSPEEPLGAEDLYEPRAEKGPKPSGVGERFVRRSQPNPFVENYTVKILDVKGGYTQYQFDTGGKSSCESNTFHSLYKKIED